METTWCLSDTDDYTGPAKYYAVPPIRLTHSIQNRLKVTTKFNGFWFCEKCSKLVNVWIWISRFHFLAKLTKWMTCKYVHYSFMHHLWKVHSVVSVLILVTSASFFVGIEGIDRGATTTSDRGVAPPPGFCGTDGFMWKSSSATASVHCAQGLVKESVTAAFCSKVFCEF